MSLVAACAIQGVWRGSKAGRRKRSLPRDGLGPGTKMDPGARRVQILSVPRAITHDSRVRICIWITLACTQKPHTTPTPTPRLRHSNPPRLRPPCIFSLGDTLHPLCGNETPYYALWSSSSLRVTRYPLFPTLDLVHATWPCVFPLAPNSASYVPSRRLYTKSHAGVELIHRI